MSPVVRTLEPHRAFPCSAVSGLRVAATRAGDRLTLAYTLEGRLDDLRIPAAGAAERADELWRHTCFEAFVRAPGDAAYWEFNLAPSTRWQAYRFTGYRERAPDPEVDAPTIAVSRGDRSLSLTAVLDLPLSGSWRLAISAVTEDVRGDRGYWALRHPDGQPDFHHAHGFDLTLDPS